MGGALTDWPHCTVGQGEQHGAPGEGWASGSHVELGLAWLLSTPPDLSHPLILRDPGASPLTLLGMGGIPLGAADSPWLGGAQPPVPALPPAPVLHPTLAEAQRMTQTQGQAKQARGPSSPPCP